MKTLNDYKKSLVPTNHTIRQFSLEGVNPTFALVKVKPNKNFLFKALGLDIENVIFSSSSFTEIAKRADALLRAV